MATPGQGVPFRHSLLYTSMDSMKPNYDPLASLKKAALADHGPNGCAMMICHPGYLDAYLLRTSSLTVPRTTEVEVETFQYAPQPPLPPRTRPFGRIRGQAGRWCSF